MPPRKPTRKPKRTAVARTRAAAKPKPAAFGRIQAGNPEWGARLVGVHCSTAGGIATGIDRGEALGCRAVQLFVKNNNRWLDGELSMQDVAAFQVARAAARSVQCLFSHAGYLINLASGHRATTERSMESMRSELDRAEQLGLDFVVLHPGAHVGDGELTGVRRVADRLNILLDEGFTSTVKIVLENTAGQGTGLGHRFEQLRDILDRVRDYHRIGVCLDTAHLFAAGYDFRTPTTYAALWEEFDRVVGRRWLTALHLNDSKKGLGSRVDRHEHIGHGQIGAAGFRMLMRDERLATLPMVCETPKGKTDAEDRANLWTLWRMLQRNGR